MYVRERRNGRNPCCPLPFGTYPNDALYGLRLSHWIDVVKYVLFHAPAKLFDQRLEHLCVCGLNQLGRGEHV